MTKIRYTLYSLLFLFCISSHTYGIPKYDIISVIHFGIPNDGSIIGPELNTLISKCYGKTVYFPAGTYNLSEPIILPYDYTKNVNLIFDKSAILKCDIRLEALLKIGYSEMSTPDVTQRRFSYIEGGMFDCSNVDNGIMVNGLKQLVSLRYISLFNGRHTHIRIGVSDDFIGTSSCDTKIDNITIQGSSSNEEVYGIYIDHSCCDCKISNCFIYGTKYGIITKSAGHILNNVHILSMHTGGGMDLGLSNNYRHTEGIRVESDGFFIFNEIYYDTIDKAIVVEADKTPTLVLDKNIFYSYLQNFGTSFLYKDPMAITPFQVKMSNCVIEVANKGYKIFDINPALIGSDIEHNFSLTNCAIRNSKLLDPLDPSLSQRVRGKNSDILFGEDQSISTNHWIPIGAIIASNNYSTLRIDLPQNQSFDLDIVFREGDKPLIKKHGVNHNISNGSLQIGYAVKDSCCVLLVKTKDTNIQPIINDLKGTGLFMPPPSKASIYSIEDYNISTSDIIII